MRISKDDASRSSKSACILGLDFLECFFHGSQPLRCKEAWTRLLNQRHHRDRHPGKEEAILDVPALANIPVEFSCHQTTQGTSVPNSGSRNPTPQAAERLVRLFNRKSKMTQSNVWQEVWLSARVSYFSLESFILQSAGTASSLGALAQGSLQFLPFFSFQNVLKLLSKEANLAKWRTRHRRGEPRHPSQQQAPAGCAKAAILDFKSHRPEAECCGMNGLRSHQWRISSLNPQKQKDFLSDQCKEIEENNRIGKTSDLFKKIRDSKGTFHAKMGSIKDRNGMDLTEAEDIKKRWQEYTEELYKKDLHDEDNHDGVITHLEPDILECEVKWALESIMTNKASGGDGIPVELFQILKDDAVKVLHSICQQIWKTQQWPQDWKRSVFIPIPKKGNAKECSNYLTIALISHASKVMLKILQARLQQYVNRELPDVQAGFRKGRGTRDQIANIRWIMEKAREFQKNIYFCFIDYAKAFDCVDHN
ncbi:uncharacterized protein LOC129538573, partial [Moschus berezovskii]|uniref:uncharacterized protein LOC129538573 n=1 Tax=Moschus berezovskii TaxID=68408 RepID=UPI002443F000